MAAVIEPDAAPAKIALFDASPPGPDVDEIAKHGLDDGEEADGGQPANGVEVEDFEHAHSAQTQHEGAARHTQVAEQLPRNSMHPQDPGPDDGTENQQHRKEDVEMKSAFYSLQSDRSLVDEGGGPGASIPISIPNEGEPASSGQVVAAEEEESASGKYGKRLFQLAILVGIVCALVFGGQAVGEAFEKMRSGLQKIPVWAFTLGLVIVDMVRKCIPPTYFLFPVGTIAAMYYGDAMGAIKGALVLKLCELTNAVVFLVVRRLYAASIQDLFETGQTRFSRVFPPSIRGALQHFDNGWLVWTLHKPWYQQLAVMVALQTSFYMDDLITILWLASRSGVTWPLYCASLVLYLCADFPRKVLQVDTYIAASDALSSGGNFLLQFFDAFTRLATWQVVCICLCSVTSTIFVHGNHLYVVINLLRTCCGGAAELIHEFDKVEEGAQDSAVQEQDPEAGQAVPARVHTNVEPGGRTHVAAASSAGE